MEEKRLVDLEKSVYEICSLYPEIAGILASLGFSDITKQGMLQTAGRFMTIPKGAKMKKIDLSLVKEKLREGGYEPIEGGE